MTADERVRLLAKIRKCLALSKSSNPHEAAAALRQAQAMMATAGMSDADLDAAEASAAEARATCSTSPGQWEARLASIVGTAFGVRIMFTGTIGSREKGKCVFIGTGAAPEVAEYAFTVLLRLVVKARADYRATLKRYGPKNRLRLCDLFCDGWVSQVAKHVNEFARPVRNDKAIDAYIALVYGKTGQLAARDRNEGELDNRQWGAVAAGMQAASNVRLQHGVGGTHRGAALTGSLALEAPR